MSEPAISISVVIPVYAGEAFLRKMMDQLQAVREDWRARSTPFGLAEVILVDDSAIDGSPALIDALAAEFNWIVPLHLMRNFGQHAATIAGILHSSGDWVVTLDEDLQHPPLDIEKLLRQAVLSGCDIVYAKPAASVHRAKSRDWTSRVFKWFMSHLTGNKNVRDFNSFRLIRGPLARAASSVCGHETYFDVALSWYTNRVVGLPLNLQDERYIKKGKSGYNFRKLLTHARRLLISSQVKVVRIVGMLGLFVVMLSLLVFFWIVFSTIGAPDTFAPTGWASQMVVTLFFGGLITLMISIMLEYLTSLVLVANGKPIFFTVDRSRDRPIVQYFETATNDHI